MATRTSVSTNYPEIKKTEVPGSVVGGALDDRNENTIQIGAALDDIINRLNDIGFQAHFAYSVGAPLQDADIHTTAIDSDMYMGISFTNDTEWPTEYSAYRWFKFRGNDGTDGNSGTKIYCGQTLGVGDSADAGDGDYFLDTEDGKLYLKSSGTWSEVVTLKGTNGNDARGISSAAINATGNLIITYTDLTTADLGVVVGLNGNDAQVSWTVQTDNDSTSCSFAVKNGIYKKFGNASISSLTLTTDSTWSSGHASGLSFMSPSTATTLTAPNNWKFKGDDCSDGVFTPSASTVYQLFVMYDGTYNVITVLTIA